MNMALAEQTHDTLGVDEIFKKAILSHQSEQFAQAEDLYLSILQIDPKHPDTNYNLGLMGMQLGKYEMGLPYLQTAWESDPTIGQYWLTLTECLLEMGYTEEALMIIEDAILRGIDLPQSLPLLMRVKEQQEKEVKLSSASELVDAGQNVVNFNKSMQSVDQSGLDGHQSLSNYLINCPTDKKTSHKSSKTKSGTLKNVIVKPASISRKKITKKEREALKSLYDNGSFDEAESLAIKMTSHYPKDAFGWKILGVLLGQFKRREEALLALQKATLLSIGDAEGHYNLGIVYRSLERLNDAEKSFRFAIKLVPKYAAAFNNLGLILFEKKHIQEAKSCFEEALLILPNYAEAHRNMATVLHVLGDIDESVIHLKRARQIDPDLTDLNTTLLFYMSEMVGVSSEELFAEHCRYGDYVEGPLRASWPQHDNLRDPEKILKIGFVSGDFYKHAVSSFIEPVLIHLMKYPQLSLYAYSDPGIEDEVTNRVRGYFSHWYSMTGVSDEKLAEKIRGDGIDILVDLSGHTARNRLLTFARKPAPVQLSWIGYPGTTGLQSMDYYLMEPFSLPPGKFDDQFTEKIVYLAGTPFSPSDLSPPVNTLPALKNGYITFGSFNRQSKINPSVIALWSELLRALPESKMLLDVMPVGGRGDWLIELFSLEGIAAERLILHPRAGTERYLALHHQVDICLDTFPYNGATTCLNALWMGVPTLTLAGSTLPGRLGAGMLGQVGLSSFVAEDKSDFVEKGLSWANSLIPLSSLRLELRERFKQSTIGQPTIIALSLERALRIMWRRWCMDLPAESFEVRRQDVEKSIPVTSVYHFETPKCQTNTLEF
jgi:predicted O-linked N-acetylglucosamine transferase (SPINDLY family)